MKTARDVRSADAERALLGPEAVERFDEVLLAHAFGWRGPAMDFPSNGRSVAVRCPRS